MQLSLAVILVAASAAAAPVAPRVATEVQRGCRHYFLAGDGSTVEVVAAEKECADLALPGAGQPQRAGATWLKSENFVAFDTPDGRLQEGDVEVVQDGIIVFVGGAPAHLEGARVVNDRVIPGKPHPEIIITNGLVERRGR